MSLETAKTENETAAAPLDRREWISDLGTRVLAVYALVVAANIWFVFSHWGGEENQTLIANIFSFLVYIGPAFFAFRTSRNKLLPTRTRRAWFVISLAGLSYGIAGLAWLYFENYLSLQPFPSPADAFFLLFYPLMMAGLLLLVEKMKSLEEWIGLVLDSCLILFGGGLAIWYFLLEPIAAGGGGDLVKTVLSLAYPVGDLVLLLGISSLLLRRRRFSIVSPVGALLVGVVGLFVADFYFGYANLQGTYQSGDPVDALYTIAFLWIMIAGQYEYLRASASTGSSSASSRTTISVVWLPYLAVAFGYAVLFLVEFRDDRIPGLDIMLATVMTTLVVIRQAVLIRENTRANLELTLLQQRIQGIYSASTDGIGIADFDGNLLEVNDAFSRLIGYEHDELISRFTIADLTAEHDQEITQEMRKTVVATQEPVDYEKECVRSDGSAFNVLVTVFPIRSPQGTPLAIAVIIRDITERKRSENLLREAEERWQLALRVNRDGVWDWDLRTDKFYFSPRWREMFGYDADADLPFILANYGELFHPDDRHLAYSSRRSLADPDTPYIDFEFRHMCQDGSYRWVRCRAESVIDATTGRIQRVTGLNTDISEKKRREIESEAISNILKGVSETSNLDELLALVHGSISNVIHARNCFVALHDKATDLFSMQFFVDERDEIPAAISLEGTRSHYVFRTGRALLLDEQKTAEFEAKGKFRLVGSQPKYWLGVPLRTPNEVIGVLVVQSYDEEHSYSERHLEFLNNVAGPIALAIERKRAESRMLLLNTALNAAANAIVITDGEGTIEWVNPAFTALTEYSIDEVRGKSPRLLQSGKHPEEFYADLWQTINHGRPWKGEITNRRKSGQLYDEEMTITPVYDKASGTKHFIAIKSDITERKLAEEQLRIFNEKLLQSNRELQDFAYVASHDLQEPLRKVQTFADRLRSKYGEALDETGLDYLERMRSAGCRMQILIQDLLSFSRVTTKAQPFVPVDLEEITAGVLSDLEVKIDETGAIVETDGLPTIDADPSQMRQLIQNLVGNALKFHRDGVAPVVRISAEPMQNGSSGCFQVTVADNGIGFDEKYLDKIFTVFQRLHGRAEYEGSGIGLAVCRKIVERHHGSITAHSTPGEGARFVMTLSAQQHTKELS